MLEDPTVSNQKKFVLKVIIILFLAVTFGGVMYVFFYVSLSKQLYYEPIFWICAIAWGYVGYSIIKLKSWFKEQNIVISILFLAVIYFIYQTSELNNYWAYIIAITSCSAYIGLTIKILKEFNLTKLIKTIYKKRFFMLIFFVSYPITSLLLFATGLGTLVHPTLLVFSMGIFYCTFFLLFIQRKKIGDVLTTFPLYMLLIFFLILIGIPEIKYYSLLGIILFTISLTYIIRNDNISKKIDEYFMKNVVVAFLTVWAIYIFAASISTAAYLAHIEFVQNIILVFVFGIVFGWFGPELLSKYLNGKYGYLLALAFPLLLGLFFISVFLFLGWLNSSMQKYQLDTGFVITSSLISIPSMLMSRYLLEILKKTSF